MNAEIPQELIERQVLEAMASLGIAPIRETRLIFDHQLHRYAVEGDKGTETSGAYLIHPDALPAGYLQSWRHGVEVRWKFDIHALGPGKYQSLYRTCRSPEFQAQARAAQKKREEADNREKAVRSDDARIRFEAAPYAQDDHPYLVKKHVPNYGLRLHEKSLMVPLRDIDGHFKSFQWIAPDGTKRYFPGAPTGGGFFSIGLDTDGPILLCEGYATGATLHELTGLAVACAMNCHNMVTCAPLLRKKYPQRPILVMADDDSRTKGNPGMTKAQEAMRQGKLNAVLSPPFRRPEDGTDWNDFAGVYGYEAAEKALKERIRWACMSEADRAEFRAKHALKSMHHTLDRTVQLPPVEMVGGMFPKGHISAVIAAPGVGKTWFVQKFVSDLSIGGSIFNGFAEEEGPQRSLIFAGETGYELLIRRAAETGWPANKDNVSIYSVIECELKDISLELDEEEGRKNIERAIEMDRPQVVIFDTLVSFHSKDENKAVEMKPIFKYLLKLAREKDIAVVLMHHTRKRKLNEQKFAMTQDEAIGSSVFNRLVSLIIGIEPIEGAEMDSSKTNLVKVQKTWFSKFPSFTYRVTDDENERTVMQIDLDPAIAGGNRTKILEYIERTYEAGVWFKVSDLLRNIESGLSSRHVRRCLATLVQQGKLEQRGQNRGAEYALVGFYHRRPRELSDNPLR